MNPELKNYYATYDPYAGAPTLDYESLDFAAEIGWNFPDGAELMRGFNAFSLRK